MLFLFLFLSLFFLPVIMYIPSLSFVEGKSMHFQLNHKAIYFFFFRSSVTGHNIHVVNTVVCYICVFYTMLGGIQAVVWTDVLQASIMIVSVVLVALLGISDVGGLAEVWRRAVDGNRIFPPEYALKNIAF